jgi:hypothetical protein
VGNFRVLRKGQTKVPKPTSHYESGFNREKDKLHGS